MLFRTCLKNMHLLYSGVHVLILHDEEYMERFWTNYEAWLSMKTVHDGDMRPARQAKGRSSLWQLVSQNADEPGERRWTIDSALSQATVSMSFVVDGNSDSVVNAQRWLKVKIANAIAVTPSAIMMSISMITPAQEALALAPASSFVLSFKVALASEGAGAAVATLQRELVNAASASLFLSTEAHAITVTSVHVPPTVRTRSRRETVQIWEAEWWTASPFVALNKLKADSVKVTNMKDKEEQLQTIVQVLMSIAATHLRHDEVGEAMELSHDASVMITSPEQ